jgi:hypothetical protein
VAAGRELATGGEVGLWGWYFGGRRERESGRIASRRGGDARNGDNRGRGGLETSVPR